MSGSDGETLDDGLQDDVYRVWRVKRRRPGERGGTPSDQQIFRGDGGICPLLDRRDPQRSGILRVQ